MALTQEMRVELESLICEAMDKREKTQKAQSSKDFVFRRVCESFQNEFNAFNYIYHWEINTPDGRNVSHDSTFLMDAQIRNAISALLRTVYQVERVRNIPADKEDDLRWFIGELLSLMRELQTRNSET